MRVLAISTPSTTHFMPAIPLVWALRAAGHDVVFAGQPDVVGMARGAGLPTVTIGSLFDAYEFLSDLPEGKRPLEAGLGQLPDDRAPMAAVSWIMHAKYLAEPYRDFAALWKPDLILTDPLEYGAILAGAALGVPTVQHRWGLEALSSAGLALARVMLRGRALRMGLPDGFPEPATVLDPLPPSLAIPQVPAGMPIRPVPYNGGGVAAPRVPERSARRRVCVTFGTATVRLNGLPLVRAVVDAFAGIEDAEAVVTLEAAQREALGPVAGNIRLIDPTPINTFADGCDLIVHHGGTRTAITGVAAGLPHLLLPQIMDQTPRSRRLEEAGAGIALYDAQSQNDPAAIRGALLALLEEPGYRETAAKLRAEAEAMPSPAEVAVELEKLAAGAHRR